MNPARSANRTVTSRRSPSSDRRGGRSGTRARGLSRGGRRSAPADAGGTAASLPPHLGQKAKSAWTVDPQPGQVIGCHSLLHVAGAPQRGVAVVPRAGAGAAGFPGARGPVYNRTSPCPSSPRAPEGDRPAMLPDTLGHLFDIPLRLAPSSVAVIQGDTTLTYADLDAWCNRAANALAGAGRERGPPRRPHVLERLALPRAFLGPMRIGAVSVPLNIRMGDEALAYVIAGRGGDGADRRPRPGRARPAAREPGQGAGPRRGRRAPRRRRARVGRVARGRLPALPPAPDRPGLGVHAALHLRLDRQAQGRPAGPRRPDLERGHHPEDGVPRRHGARAGRGAALSQERDDRRGEAVPPRRRVARDPARLRPASRSSAPSTATR